jgi:hypothetical protein
VLHDLWISSLCNFLYPAAISCLAEPEFIIELFSSTLSCHFRYLFQNYLCVVILLCNQVHILCLLSVYL